MYGITCRFLDRREELSHREADVSSRGCAAGALCGTGQYSGARWNLVDRRWLDTSGEEKTDQHLACGCGYRIPNPVLQCSLQWVLVHFLEMRARPVDTCSACTHVRRIALCTHRNDGIDARKWVEGSRLSGRSTGGI